MALMSHTFQSSFNTTHPELQTKEHFITNVSVDRKDILFKYKDPTLYRQGKQAYDIYGRKIFNTIPIFANG
jgi:hypothetical protein